MPQVLPNSRIPFRTVDAPAPLRLWHLASLDAPTVALAWSLAFAWAAHVHLPLWVLVLLALAVWAVYVADRLLDAHSALRTDALHRLRHRHLFHHRHRRILMPLAIAAATAAACIVFALMPPVARERNSILAAASLVYFTRVHTGRNLAPLIPKFLSKEFLVGVLFTAGCALPALTRAALPARALIAPLLIPAALFALLAWLNCHAIDRWESDPGIPTEDNFINSRSTHFTANGTMPAEHAEVSGHDFSRAENEGSDLKGTGFSPYIEPTNGAWALAPEGNLSNPSPNRISSLAIFLSLAALLLAALPSTPLRSAALLIAAAAAALLIALLDRCRSRLTPIALRAAVDLVLLTPALLLTLQ